jgi:hypothetical protein
MRKRCLMAVAFIALVVAASTASAGYPFIADVPNMRIPMNTSSGVIHFRVSDDTTPAEQLLLSSRSDSPDIVPADDAHISLGGSGQDRTLVITPLPDQTGTAILTLVVTDGDGDRNRDSFEVEVTR